MPNIPNCSNCEDKGELKKFKGFYQERYGKRRTIRLDGSSTAYTDSPKASKKQSIKCTVCGWSPELSKIKKWAETYDWKWPPPPEAPPFDARKMADELAKWFKSLGTKPLRFSIAKSEPKFKEFPGWIDERVKAHFRKKSIDRLYHYQSEALESLRTNRVTVVQAPTGAGKSLIYQAFYLNAVAQNKKARMLALFPAQALVKDQGRALVALTDNDGVIPSGHEVTQLGFTITNQPVNLAFFFGRDEEGNKAIDLLKRIRSIDVLMGTPDKLFVHLYKDQFTPFLKDLELIVVDEAHMATGIFGGNYAFLIRRLLTLAPKAKLLIMSATFTNVKDFTATLCGEQVFVVDGSDTRVTSREVMLVPVWKQKRKGKVDLTVDTITATLDTIAQIININKNQLPFGIIFGRSKRGLAWMLNLIEKRVSEGSYPLAIRDLPTVFMKDIAAEIKDDLLKALHDREIGMMLATNALELGIDVGAIDFVILESLLESDLSFIQRIGRAGRSRDGLAIMFIERDPYQEYWLKRMSGSKELSLGDVKPLPIALSNPRIIRNNYIRFYWEAKTHLDFTMDRVKQTFSEWISSDIGQLISRFDNGHDLCDEKYVETLKKDPMTHNLVSMRTSITVEDIDIIDRSTGKKKGSVSLDDFFRDLHENAVWRDEKGTPFKVVDFGDYDKSGLPGKAFVEKERNKDRRTYGVVKVIKTEGVEGFPPTILVDGGKDFHVKYGSFKIETKSPGYIETVGDKSTFISYDKNSRMSKIKRPKYETIGMILHNKNWESPEPDGTDAAKLDGFRTLFQKMASHSVGAAPQDIQCGDSLVEGKIYVIDASAGGNGVTRQIVDDLLKILKICKTVITTCKCKKACYSCILPRASDINVQHYDKDQVLNVIKWMEKIYKHANIPANL